MRPILYCAVYDVVLTMVPQKELGLCLFLTCSLLLKLPLFSDDVPSTLRNIGRHIMRFELDNELIHKI